MPPGSRLSVALSTGCVSGFSGDVSRSEERGLTWRTFRLHWGGRRTGVVGSFNNRWGIPAYMFLSGHKDPPKDDFVYHFLATVTLASNIAAHDDYSAA